MKTLKFRSFEQVQEIKDFLKYAECIRNRKSFLEYIWVSTWRYKKDIKYWISYYHQNEFLFLFKWDITDLASSPCFTQCLFPKERYVMACIHDKWYASKEAYVYVIDKNNLSLRFKELQKHWKWINDNTFLPNKKFWDLLFLYWMLEEDLVFYGKKSLRPYFWYLAVKLFWFKFYHRF
jgi:hypothetical protein